MKAGPALVATLSLLGAAGIAHADNAWSTHDYNLYAGDFDGDGRSDILYIARDPARLSGIALADETGFNTALQTWGNAYLGIPWSGGHYNVVVGDFNGDGRDDLFLQRRTPGDHYLILTEEGGIGAISQAVPNDAAGIEWSADAHRIVAGDFDGDGHADLLLQPTSPSRISAVMLSDRNGQFTAAAPAKSWRDGYAGFRWAVDQATVFVGDFDGDGFDDLLVQARPLAGTGPGTNVPATFEPNANGVLLAQPGAQIFLAEHLQAWGQEGFSAQWSPLRSTPIVGDLNGDGRDDVILQGLTANERSYLLYGRKSGAIFERAWVLDEGAVAPGDQARAIAGSFASAGADALYFQQRDTVRSNRVVGYGQAKPSVLLDDASIATGTQIPELLSEMIAQGGGGIVALQTPTSAGRTPGQFAVSAMGAATYQIPIWTPPGARGVEPSLALVYSSGGPDGALGPGWSLSGLSVLARCNKTYAANGGTPAPVTLTSADNFCLDGNRLRLTSGTYGIAGSTYQSEIADFSRVTAYGVVGYGPMYFFVEGKDGLTYEYGTSADARAFTIAGSTPYAWLLSKIRDRQGNNLRITYSTTSGDVQPASIQYTQVPSKSMTYPYTVTFTYQNRVTNLSKYVAGGKIEQTKVLSKINIQSSGTSVRQYNLEYQAAPTTLRDRLVSVQECGGSTGTDCLRPTTIAYQNGQAGIASPTTSVVASSTSRTSTADVNGDGKTDLIYSTGTETAAQWSVRFANADGSYGSAISTGLTASSNANSLFADFYGDGRTVIVAPASGVWQVTRWNGSAFVTQSTGIAFDASSSNVLADTDGDGLPDLVTLRADAYIYTRRNVSTQYSPSLATAIQALSWGYAPGTPGDPGLFSDMENVPGNAFAGVKFADFNGDGRQDIVGRSWGLVDAGGWSFYLPVYYLLLSGGSTFAYATYYVDATSFGGLGNVNNDACTDVISRGLVYVSPCNGGQGQQISTSGLPLLGAVDWDGDGRDDLLLNNNGQVQWQRSLGSTFATTVNTSLSIATGARYVSSDSNGDGLVDLIQKGTGGALSYGLHHGAHTPADLATSITDGWGISAAPSYVPITQNNYTKGSGAALPDFDFQSPLYVVSQVQQSDGTGANFTNSFWYTGARVNRQGRGFLGFNQTQTQDSRNGLYRRISYRQDFPYAGGVSQDDSFQPNGTSLISRTVNTYQVIDLGGIGCAGGRCFPYVSSSTATNYEITGGNPLIQTTVSGFTYDSFGNATQVSTTTTDNHSASPFYGQSWSSAVSHTITNDATYWCLGKPTVTTTQNTVPGQAAATRRVDHAVDYVNCRFTSETLEPGSALLKVETGFGFDTCGNMNSMSVVGRDKTGAAMPARTTTTNYGTRCQLPESVTNALGQTATVSYRYDIGDKASTTDPNAVSVSWLYDNFARRILETRADGTRTGWAYSDCVAATCWGVSDLKFLVTETLYDTSLATVRTRQQFFDGLERLRFDEGHRVLGTWTNTQTVYDSLGRQIYTYLPYSSVSSGYRYFTYDLLNRPLSDYLYNSSGTLDRTTSVAYAGLKTTLTDAKGHATQKWADVTGSIRRITDPSPGDTTHHTFDPFGNLVQSIDATGATSSNTYNIRGFKTVSSDPDAGSWTYVPNSLNELVSQTDAKGQVTTFDYDKLGRMTSRLEPESATPTTWTYGTSAAARNIGRLQSLSKPDGYAENYSFDAIGRPSVATYTMDASSYQVNYAYNNIGAVDTLTYPTSTSGYRLALKYAYSYGFLQQIKDNATGSAYWTLNSANDAGSPLTEVLGNGVLITSGYKAWTNELTSRKEGTGGSTNNLQDLAYQWDLNGNLSQRQDLKQGLTEAFVNDALNRLTSSTLNGVTNLSVGHNAAGNITSKSDIGSYNYTTAQAGCAYYAYAQPHAVRKAGSAVYCYDANGNVTSRGGGAISWYSYNQPNQISYASNSTQFFYNANHQRWKQVANYGGVTETTLYVGGMLEKVTRIGVTEYRHLIPAGSGSAIYTRRDTGTASTYYVSSDHLGSGDLVMDSAANVLARESFTPFGARRGSNWQGTPTSGDYSAFQATTRRGFTSHEMLDAVSLVHMNGRVYDPYVGRFLSPDPIIQTLGLSQALNPFSYVMNNPLSLIDPSGYSWLSKAFKSIGKFFKKFWRPIVAIVVAFVSYGYLAPMASQWLATSVCLAPGTITVGGAAIAGGIAGALAGGITGGWKGAALGAIGGALTAGIATWGGSTLQARALAGAANGLVQTGTPEGSLRGALSGFLPDDLWMERAYLHSAAANQAIRVVGNGVRGAIIDGNDGVRRSVGWGLGLDALGHLFGAIASGMRGPTQFSRGVWEYNTRWDSAPFEAITFGNVVSFHPDYAPGQAANTPWLNSHEREHVRVQSALGPAYLPLHIMSQWVPGPTRYFMEQRPWMPEFPYSSMGGQ